MKIPSYSMNVTFDKVCKQFCCPFFFISKLFPLSIINMISFLYEQKIDQIQFLNWVIILQLSTLLIWQVMMYCLIFTTISQWHIKGVKASVVLLIIDKINKKFITSYSIYQCFINVKLFAHTINLGNTR